VTVATTGNCLRILDVLALVIIVCGRLTIYPQGPESAPSHEDDLHGNMNTKAAMRSRTFDLAGSIAGLNRRLGS